MQLLIIKLLCTLSATFSLFLDFSSCTELAGKYDEGNLSFKTAWSYIVVINNCSQVVSWCIFSPDVFPVAMWRRGGLMVSVLNFGSSGLGSSPGRGHSVVFLGKTLYSRSASLHPGIQLGTGEFNTVGSPAMDYHLIRGE